MDEEQKTEPKIIEELKEKAAIESQLDSYINPSEAPDARNKSRTVDKNQRRV